MIGLPRSFRVQNRVEAEPRRPSPAMKRFMARYIFYLELIGYLAVSLIALAVVACFFFSVNDTITGDAVPIKARTESIKAEAGALVTRVFVQNHQSVRWGDPLVEVVEKPEWISRYRVMHQMRLLLEEMETPGASTRAGDPSAGQDTANAGAGDNTDAKDAAAPPLPKILLTPEEQKLRDMLKQRLADWDASEAAMAPRVVIRSPIDGVVVASDDLSFKQMNADEEILKVADLNDLRLTVKFNSGDTIADARVGQKAIIKAISPEYKNGVTLRGDTVPRGRPIWQRERVTSAQLLGSKIKKIVKDAFKDRTVTQRDDLPFKVTDIKKVEVDADLETALGSRLPAAGKGGSAAAGSREPGARRSIQADAPADLELTGKVLEGKHRLNVQIADLPPAVRTQVAALVVKKMKGRLIDAPQQPKKEGGPTPEDRLRVEAVRNVQVIAQVKGENTDAKGASDRLKRQAARTALRGAPYEKMSDARQFEATVQITNPPQFLKDEVLELMDQGKDVKAKAEVITGRRPVAFLLLKR
jgi:hypothetical protein